MLALSPHLIGGWGIYMLVVTPEHSVCRNLNLGPVDITEALVFKLVLIVKDITLVADSLVQSF